ncbi:hypothetical protein BDR06DRAFT_208220 [Suillus hirtellus]|nr:hypothetical protein BDR06DRAFT_208220 [Suillus hirtellus]
MEYRLWCKLGIVTIVKRIHCGVQKIPSQAWGRPFAATVIDGSIRRGGMPEAFIPSDPRTTTASSLDSRMKMFTICLHMGCALAPIMPSIIEMDTITTVEKRIVKNRKNK